MRKFLAGTALAVAVTAPVTVAAVPAHAATSHHVTHDLRDTNWPCAGC